MRPRFAILILAILLQAAPVAAAPYTLTDAPRVDFWRANYMPQRPAKEPSAEDLRFAPPKGSQALASRLGVVDGTAELFRYEVDKNPAAKASIDGGLGGHGVRLRMRW